MRNRNLFVWMLLIILSSSHAYAKGKPYVFGNLQGRLGNLLFEIAATSAVAWDNGADPFFPKLVNSYAFEDVLFRCHDHIDRFNTPVLGYSCQWKTDYYTYKPIPYTPNMMVYGFSQNEKYFAHHRQRLLKLFAPKDTHLAYIQRYYGNVLEHPNAVSVHVRAFRLEDESTRGDESIYPQYGRDYFERAMALFPRDSLFVVFSDRIDFAKEVISTEGRNVLFVEDESYCIDFYLQSLCDHNIIANSTFSWWSAWLNQNPDKIVVRPKQWMTGCYEHDDIGSPESWIKIEAKSNQGF